MSTEKLTNLSEVQFTGLCGSSLRFSPQANPNPNHIVPSDMMLAQLVAELIALENGIVLPFLPGSSCTGSTCLPLGARKAK